MEQIAFAIVMVRDLIDSFFSMQENLTSNGIALINLDCKFLIDVHLLCAYVVINALYDHLFKD